MPPQDQYRQINGPDGPINFPANMSDGDVTQAMQRLYPPKTSVPEATIGVHNPSKMEQLEDAIPVLRHISDIFHGGKGSMRPEDTTQLMYPERVFSPMEQAAHPVRTGFDEFAGSLTSPDNILLMHGFGAMGIAAGRLGRILPRLASAAFAGQMGKGSYDAFHAAHENWQQYKATGNEEYKNEAMRLGTHSLLNGAMAMMSGAHSAMGEPAINNNAADLPGKVGQFAKSEPQPVKPALKPQDIITPVETPKPLIVASRARENLTSPPESGIMVVKGEEKPMFTPKDLRQALPTQQVPNLGTPPKPTSIEPESRPLGESEIIFQRGRRLQSQGLSESEIAFKLMQEYPHRADEIANAYKKTPSSIVGREATPGSEPIQPKESIQATTATTGSGESVLAAPRPSVEDTSKRLGTRDPQPAVDPWANLAKDKQAMEMAAAERDAGKLPEGMSYVQRAQQLKEQLMAEPRSVRGSLPTVEVFQQRVTEFLKRNPSMAEGTARRMVSEQIRKERGSLSFKPLSKPAPVQGTPVQQTSLGQLTDKVESALKATPPDDSRMRIAERLDKTLTDGWDKTQLALGRVAAQAVALKDMWLREPEMTDYRSSVGRFSGALNRSAWELRQFTKEIKNKLPDAQRREAITNWIQAGGDDQILADRAGRSKGMLRAGYEAARNLTPEEKTLAKMIVEHFDKRLKEAIDMGVLKSGLENYVPQVWKPKDQTNAVNFFSSLHRSGLLKTDFNSAKRRIFDSYFEGEQAGRIPVNKDIGFLLSSWEKALNQAVASRSFIRDLSYGLAKDGRPIVAPSGKGKPAFDEIDPAIGVSGQEKPNAYFIYPKAGPDETGDYKALNHPALTKWTWATKDENGAPIFMKGDLRVHPDHAQTLDNVINRGKWASAHPVQTAILKGQSFFKQTLLAASPFHQIQEGTHAIFHKVNPFNPGQIDLANPSMTKLLDHGLVIGNFDPVAAFEEGVTTGGAVGKIPGLGRFMQKYTDYLFQDYIPRLKAKMGVEAYERNIQRFSDDIAKGKITSDQVAELTANQANAAFGELNYVMMGRHPQTQAMLRMMFLAPDFLEARGRFVGQALRPYGREQYAALFRGAMGMYATARILNQLLDDDPHWDRPFSLVVKGYEYKMRSLPGDIWHLMTDPNSFVMHRLNPTLIKPFMELATGKDDFGRRRTAGEQVMDFARGVMPISTQGFLKSGNKDKLGGILSGLGVTRSVYRTEAGALAHQYAISSIPTDITSHHVAELVQDMQNGELDSNKVASLLREGKMNLADFKKARELVRLPELYRDYHRLPVEQKAKVFLAATPNEKALLRQYSHKELDTTKLLPEQRQEFMEERVKQ